jgi:(p)ppGpp synthase/HD superfamily hydrolase
MKKGEGISLAIMLATKGHTGQTDRGGHPYILHPLQVMSFLEDDDEELKMIAVMHDLIEDTSITYEDLNSAGFSDRVITGIRALTKIPGKTLEEYKEAVFSNMDAMKVKICDLRHNTDLRRLKKVTEKDIARMARYHLFYTEIKAKLLAW